MCLLELVAYCRSYVLPLYKKLSEVALFMNIENYYRDLIFLAKRESRGIHDLELHSQRVHIGKFFKTLRVGILLWIFVVNTIYFVAFIRHSAPISEALRAAVVSVEK